MADNTLETYRHKRRAGVTPEPSGGKHENTGNSGPIFVIQKHDASTLHYDFRLEIDGVLKSWAVPKGPSTDPRDKQLAIETEDHPLDYADFEGVIPASEYGGGTVMVWDRGRIENLKCDNDGNVEKTLSECWADGHLVVNLYGDKIMGGYGLTHFRSEGGTRQWLLVKLDDGYADARRNPVSTENLSVLSKRSINEIANDEDDCP